MSVFGVILFRIFPHSDWIRRDTEYLSAFSPNEGKCGPEQLRIRTFFTQWLSVQFLEVYRRTIRTSLTSKYNRKMCQIYSKLVLSCVCMHVYSSTVKASSVCKMSDTCLRVRINDVKLWVVYAVPLPNFFISVSDNVIFHLPRRKLQWPRTGQKTNMIYIATAKRWYTDKGCRSTTVHNRQVTERY